MHRRTDVPIDNSRWQSIRVCTIQIALEATRIYDNSSEIYAGLSKLMAHEHALRRGPHNTRSCSNFRYRNTLIATAALLPAYVMCHPVKLMLSGTVSDASNSFWSIGLTGAYTR